jgi:hypothetical protein
MTWLDPGDKIQTGSRESGEGKNILFLLQLSPKSIFPLSISKPDKPPPSTFLNHAFYLPRAVLRVILIQ